MGKNRKEDEKVKLKSIPGSVGIVAFLAVFTLAGCEYPDSESDWLTGREPIKGPLVNILNQNDSGVNRNSSGGDGGHAD
jgi:hypothetical protein